MSNITHSLLMFVFTLFGILFVYLWTICPGNAKNINIILIELPHPPYPVKLFECSFTTNEVNLLLT